MARNIDLDATCYKEILNEVYSLQTHPLKLMPTVVTNARLCKFFPSHNNRFDGWFMDAIYSDGYKELWFVVYLENGCMCDDTWHVELVRILSK